MADRIIDKEHSTDISIRHIWQLKKEKGVF